MSQSTSLPFEYTNKSISTWLSQLNESGVLLRSQELYKILATLHLTHTQLSPADLAIVVMRLTPLIIQLSNSLEKAIIKHSQAHKVALISIRTLYYLAFLHAYLAKKVGPENDKTLHLNYAMQILGIAFHHSALNYERPSPSLWDCASECYESAKNEFLLDLPVTKPFTEFQTLPTVSLALKRILLFCLVNPYRFNQNDILEIFRFSTVNASLVHFVERGMSTNNSFHWDYHDKDYYQPIHRRSETLSTDYLLFNTKVYSRFEDKQSLNINNSNQFIARLDQHKMLFETTKFSLSTPYVFVCSLEYIIDFFTKHVHKKRVLTINTPTPKDLNFSTLELVKDKDSPSHSLVDQISSTDIWRDTNNMNKSLALIFGAMKMVKTSLASHYKTETRVAQLISNDLFVCFGKDLTPILGIARRVELEFNQSGDIQNSIVELYPGSVTLLHRNGLSNKLSALLLDEQPGGKNQLFLIASKYEVGAVLRFEHVEIILERLLELSSHFMHYEVSIRTID